MLGVFKGGVEAKGGKQNRLSKVQEVILRLVNKRVSRESLTDAELAEEEAKYREQRAKIDTNSDAKTPSQAPVEVQPKQPASLESIVV